MDERYDYNLLLAYVEDELDAEQTAQVQRLLESDPRLGQLIERMRADRGQLRGMADPEPPAWVMEDVQRHLEREMLMEGTGGERDALLGPPGDARSGSVLRRIFTGGAVAAMLALVGGVILTSLTDLGPDWDLHSPVAQTDPDSTVLQPDETRQSEADRGDDADITHFDTDEWAESPTLPDAPGAVMTYSDLEISTLFTPSDLGRLEPIYPGATLGGDALDALAGFDEAAQREHAEQTAAAGDPLTFDREQAWTAERELARDLEAVAARMLRTERMDSPDPGRLERGTVAAGAEEPTSEAWVSPVLPTANLVDPLALASPGLLGGFGETHLTQHPGDPVAALDNADGPAASQADYAFSGGLSPDLAPTLPSQMEMEQGFGGSEPAPPEAAADGDDLGWQNVDADQVFTLDEPDPTQLQVRALREGAVLANELELRIEAVADTALAVLEQFGDLPEAAVGVDPARQFDLNLPLANLTPLIEALKEQEGVASVQLNRQRVARFGFVPGEPERENVAADLWPSFVPNYQAILRQRQPSEPTDENPTIKLPVRIISPMPGE